MYNALDYVFVFVHSFLVGFILLGWAWEKVRRMHLLATSLTMVSWFGLGLEYGWGYCPCTDWHWQVKTRMGEANLPASYIKYYADKLTGLDSNALWIDSGVAVLGLSAFCLSVYLNWRDLKEERR